MSHVTDFPSAAILIASRAAGRILSDEVLDQVLDTAPGGTTFLERVGHDAVRSWLRRNPHDGCDPGLAELDEFMAAKVADGALDAAHRIWRGGDAHWASVGVWAVDASLSEKEKAQMVSFWAGLSNTGMPSAGPLYVPKAPKLADALVAYDAARAATNTPLPGPARAHLDDLLCVFAPNAHSLQAYRGFAGLELRNTMWRRLADRSGLPYPGAEPAENLARLAERCGVEPTRVELRTYKTLASLCAPAAKRGSVSRTATTAGDTEAPAGLRTLADARTYILDRLDDKGRLPARASFDPSALDRIEALFCQPYTRIVESLVAECGYKAPGRTNNEVALDQIVEEALGDMIRERHVEWTDSTWRAASGAYRVDTRYVLRGSSDAQLFDTGASDWELHCEADGQGHFQRVRNWNLDECRLRDQAKTRILADRRAQVDFDVTFVAVHWRALTGTSAQRLDAASFAAIVAALRANPNRWWAFICPAGESDRRAIPAGCRLERLRGDWDDTFWVWTLVGDPTTKAI